MMQFLAMLPSILLVTWYSVAFYKNRQRVKIYDREMDKYYHSIGSSDWKVDSVPKYPQLSDDLRWPYHAWKALRKKGLRLPKISIGG